MFPLPCGEKDRCRRINCISGSILEGCGGDVEVGVGVEGGGLFSLRLILWVFCFFFLYAFLLTLLLAIADFSRSLESSIIPNCFLLSSSLSQIKS